MPVVRFFFGYTKINSFRTISSAAAFRLFIICVHSIGSRFFIYSFTLCSVAIRSIVCRICSFAVCSISQRCSESFTSVKSVV